MNWLFCLKWDPCERQERREKGVFRAAHPHTPFQDQCPPGYCCCATLQFHCNWVLVCLCCFLPIHWMNSHEHGNFTHTPTCKTCELGISVHAYPNGDIWMWLHTGVLGIHEIRMWLHPYHLGISQSTFNRGYAFKCIYMAFSISCG